MEGINKEPILDPRRELPEGEADVILNKMEIEGDGSATTHLEGEAGLSADITLFSKDQENGATSFEVLIIFGKGEAKASLGEISEGEARMAYNRAIELAEGKINEKGADFSSQTTAENIAHAIKKFHTH